MRTHPLRAAGALMIAGAVLANVAFLALGTAFDYPDVLGQPSADVLRRFHDNASLIAAFFTVLAAASAVLVPVALLTRGLIAADRVRTRRVMVVAGVAAGAVQVVGLLRWPLLVPGFAERVADPTTSAASRADAIDSFELFHAVLGGVVGETFGYALTAVWTVAIVVGITHRPGRWFAPLGIGSAALIATGLVEKLGVEAAGLTNFVGYIAWSIWMVAVGTWLIRRAPAFIPTESPLPARVTTAVAS